MALSNSPYSQAPGGEGKWGDFGGMKEIGPIIPVTPEQEHDAQLSAVELVGYAPADSKQFLEMLGINRRVDLDDNRCKDGK